MTKTLSLNELQNLNRHMVGLGAPVDRDDTGYNKPDYCRMLGIAHLYEINEAEGYAIITSLSHYKNTQLSDIKDEIENTLDMYEKEFEQIVREFEAFDLDSMPEHDYDEYEPDTDLEFTNTYFGTYVKFPYFIESESLVSFVRNTKSKWSNGKLFIPWESVNIFSKIARRIGKFGFDCTVIEEIANNLESLRPAPTKEEMILLDKSFTEVNVTITLDYNKVEIVFKPQSDFINNKIWKAKNEFGTSAWGWIKNIKNEYNSVIIPQRQLDEFKEFFGEEIELEEYWANRCGTAGYKFNYGSIGNELSEIPVPTKLNRNMINVANTDLPFTPYEFQLSDINKALESRRVLLGHDMGCGKTMMASLIAASISGKKLIIVPESLRINWRREIQNVHKDADVNILYSKDKFSMESEWNIMGYKTASKYCDEILKEKIATLIVDEAHYCKAVNNYGEPSSARAKAVMSIAEHSENVYLLTGTPMPTRNKDLWNIFQMLKADEFADSYFSTYGKEYCNGIWNGYGWDFSGSSNNKELHDILSKYMIRRTKKEVLPNLTKQRIFMPLEVTSRDYKRVEKEMRDSSGGTFLGLCQTGRRFLSAAKVKECIDFADTILDTDESVVIVSEFVDTIKTIKEYYGDNCCTIIGGMSDKDKQKAIDDFQSGKCKVCALNTIAGGVGVTLTKASKMIICDFDWTPANMAQVEDRICRVGQTEGCIIYYMYAENALMDKLFVDMITEKSANIDQIIDASENTMDLQGSLMMRLKEELGIKKETKKRTTKKTKKED